MSDTTHDLNYLVWPGPACSVFSPARLSNLIFNLGTAHRLFGLSRPILLYTMWISISIFENRADLTISLWSEMTS